MRTPVSMTKPIAALAASAAALGLWGMSAGNAQAQAAEEPPALEQPAEEGFRPPLSALAPENLNRPRPEAPFDVTGMWFVDLGFSPQSWRFGPPYPPLTPEAQAHFDASQEAAERGEVYRDDIGQCWPAGMPLIMTRVWPIAMIQLPTAVYMISHFMNSVRIVYLDGRTHTDPDVVVPTFNGESIGRWEDDTLVVDTRHFPGHNHWMDQGGAAIPASDQLRIIERIRMVEGGEQLEIEFIMTDPVHWEGEWRSTKRFNRVDDVDITEVTCFPSMNQNLPATRSRSLVE